MINEQVAREHGKGSQPATIDEVALCPFCGAKPGEHDNPALRDEMMQIDHRPECYLALDGARSMLELDEIPTWNARANVTEKKLQCGDCLKWFKPSENHECRRMRQRNSR